MKLNPPKRAQKSETPVVPEAPPVDLTADHGKADLNADMQALSSEMGSGENVLLQTPQPSAQMQQQEPIDPLAPQEDSRIEYPQWLLELLPYLPDDCPPELILQLKEQYQDIYFVELPSGIYIYRPIMRPEHRKIVNTEGINREQIEEKIVCSCTLFPRLTPFDLRDGGRGTRAGTSSTLCNTILSSSDFGHVDVQPIKL